MREIKFRAYREWQGNNKEMIPYNQLRSHCDLANVLDRVGVFSDYKIMQYTGLKDKNGVEIYEGDIIEFDKGGIGEMIGKVEWNDKWNKSGWSIGACGYYQKEVEVIGNIYENPELINN